MDNRQNQPRNGACNNYAWDGNSALRKLGSNVSVGVGVVQKQISGPHDPKKDAYRNCANCEKHFNNHGKLKGIKVVFC